MSDDSYDLDAMTVYLMQKYADGNDLLNHEVALEQAASDLSDFVYELDDYTKGIVIIDLLTLVDILGQVIQDKNLPPDPQ